ncbi:MAG: peptidyl-prolyl cis-trans isomerase [Proteobacteria bacterium]|nr:MAG: peptidyl-prolyl cis-trans isomerase [Pseudomonadota bacterium]
MVKFTTSLGEILIELYPDDAPESVENFVKYVESGFYDGTIFHRVIPDFVVQGGGMNPGMQQKPTRDPIKNEADNNLKNLAGSLSMARTNDPHSATSQFFINLKNNDFLDYRSKTPAGWGYAVFAKVVDGMDVVDKMASVKTTTFGPYSDVPAEDVVLIKAEIVDD